LLLRLLEPHVGQRELEHLGLSRLEKPLIGEREGDASPSQHIGSCAP